MAVQLSNKIRIIFFLSQLLYMAFGAVMFAIGIYSIVNLQQYGFFTQNTYVSGAAIFVVAGSFKVVFGLLGILVLFWQKKPLMITFTVGVIVLMLLTFVAGIYGFLARPSAFFTTRSRLNAAFRDYNEYADDINTVQDEFDCCGSTQGKQDYKRNDLAFGENCTLDDPRRGDPAFVLPEGCHLYLTREIQEDLYIVGAMGLGFATTELTGLLIAMQNFEGL